MQGGEGGVDLEERGGPDVTAQGRDLEWVLDGGLGAEDDGAAPAQYAEPPVGVLAGAVIPPGRRVRTEPAHATGGRDRLAPEHEVGQQVGPAADAADHPRAHAVPGVAHGRDDGALDPGRTGLGGEPLQRDPQPPGSAARVVVGERDDVGARVSGAEVAGVAGAPSTAAPVLEALHGQAGGHRAGEPIDHGRGALRLGVVDDDHLDGSVDLHRGDLDGLQALE